MVVRSYSKTASGPNGVEYTTLDYYNDSIGSPRDVDGELDLRSNPHTLKRATIMNVSYGSSLDGVYRMGRANASIADNSFPYPRGVIDTAQIQNIARAKFDGKIRKGRAGLGVQVVKYAQTRDMILGKYQQMKSVIASAHRAITRDRKLRDHLINLDRLQKLTANEVLQYQFGWRNLFSNIRAGINTVVKDAEIGNQWFTAAHAGNFEQVLSNPADGTYTKARDLWVGKVRTSVSGEFVIDNPNLYLLDRSGILSVPAIAWDLVPWSWVVNMFANTNQLVNSLTDEVGIHWNDVSYTNSARVYRVTELTQANGSTDAGKGGKLLYRTKFDYRHRTVGQRPPIALRFRLPELDYKNATIAGAIILQRMKLISWAAKPPSQPRPQNWRDTFPPGYTHL